MRAYSSDLRERLVLTYESGAGTLDEVAEEFGVGRRRSISVTLIGSLALRGLVASLSMPGALDAPAFDAFVARVLTPRLRANDIVLLDSLRVHQASRVEAAITGVKARVMWLPTYSPDLSPIENCWSKVKALVRGCAPRTPGELDAALTHALTAITRGDINGWFRHCGY